MKVKEYNETLQSRDMQKTLHYKNKQKKLRITTCRYASTLICVTSMVFTSQE